MTALQLPLLHLFQQLRAAGMKLTIEQYDLLQQALNQGFGFDWESLERICRLLWVKPSLNYDEAIFQREFARFQQLHQEQFQQYWSDRHSPPQQEIKLGQLPSLPPRRWQQQTVDPMPTLEPRSPSAQLSEEDGLGAIAPPSLKQPVRKEARFEPSDLPVSLEDVLQTWKRLRVPSTDLQREELDWEGTIDRINREGYFSDVVMRPWMRKGVDLSLLVDEGSGMTPYKPIWQVWVQAVEEQRINPSQIYSFSCGVDDALYGWHQPLQAVPLGSVLIRSHPQRSIVIVLSDAGAAARSSDEDKIQSMQRLIQQLGRSMREVIWLNPVPKALWKNTSAEAIAEWIECSLDIKGVMLPFRLRDWSERLPLVRDGVSGVRVGGRYGC